MTRVGIDHPIESDAFWQRFPIGDVVGPHGTDTRGSGDRDVGYFIPCLDITGNADRYDFIGQTKCNRI